MDSDLLRQVSLFERLPDEALAQVAARLVDHSYSAGEVLFNQGEAGGSCAAGKSDPSPRSPSRIGGERHQPRVRYRVADRKVV